MNKRTYDFLPQVIELMKELGFTHETELEAVIGGTQIYESEGAGTKWAPVKGTRKYNEDAFIVIRKHKPVISSKANVEKSECN